MRVPPHQLGYAALLAGCFLLAQLASWTALGTRIDNDTYDFFYRLAPPTGEPVSVILGIDEATLREHGGVRGLRRIVAASLERMAQAPPRVVAIDLIFPDQGDPREDQRLAVALAGLKGDILAAEMQPGGQGWESPLPLFRTNADAVGHVHASPDETDMVIRQIPLERRSVKPVRYWALALEAYRIWRGQGLILESPASLHVGLEVIPIPAGADRPLFVRYLGTGGDGGIPRISAGDWLAGRVAPERFGDRIVFVGVTAQSALSDRWMTPVSTAGAPMPGVEIHASAFETLASGRFVRRAGPLLEMAISLGFTLAAGLIFAYLAGAWVYALSAVLLLLAHATPFLFFREGLVFSFLAPVGAAWLGIAGAAGWRFFFVRKQLNAAVEDRARYQQAFQFVSHELKTPLTAIQGSSELISRYALPEEKRRELARMIASESRRLGQMIESFLNVERLTAGGIDLRKSPLPVRELIAACLGRAGKLADRKRIQLLSGAGNGEMVNADRELMEYAVYNLITNAIKYSPPDSEVRIDVHSENGRVRLSVADQGIGIEQNELSSIFQKFYRARTARSSGETGTGIGLSLVQQIMASHGGSVEVESAPGKGSRFTLILPSAAQMNLSKPAAAHQAARPTPSGDRS